MDLQEFSELQSSIALDVPQNNEELLIFLNTCLKVIQPNKPYLFQELTFVLYNKLIKSEIFEWSVEDNLNFNRLKQELLEKFHELVSSGSLCIHFPIHFNFYPDRYIQ